MKLLKENAFFIILFAVCVSFAWFQLDNLSPEEEYVEVIVSEGDSLWNLAENYTDDKRAEQWILEVKQLNGLSSDRVQSGESLRLPAKMYEEPNFQMTQVGESAR